MVGKKRKPQPYFKVRTWCPVCDSDDIETTRTEGKYRYHRCLACGQSFPSMEEDPRKPEKPVVVRQAVSKAAPVQASAPTAVVPVRRGGLKRW